MTPLQSPPRGRCYAVPNRLLHARMSSTVSWRQLDPSPDPNHGAPLPRSSHAVASVTPAVDDGTTRLLVCGGEDAPDTPIPDPRQVLWVAEGKGGGDGTWRWVSPEVASDSAPPPTARCGHAAASSGRYVYVFGGRTAAGDATADMYRIEIIHSPTWPFSPEYTVKYTRINYGNGPCARSDHAMITSGHSLYLYGGVGADGRLSDLHRFDTRFETWSDLGTADPGTDSADGRDEATLMVLEGGRKIAAVAARANGTDAGVHVFDTTTGEWDEEATAVEGPSPRGACASAALPDGRTVLFGGEVRGSYADDVVVFDGTTGVAEEAVGRGGGQSWPRARGRSGAASAGGDRFYLFGGLAGDDSGPERLGDLWEGRVSSGG